jgi:hypothetical protein
MNSFPGKICDGTVKQLWMKQLQHNEKQKNPPVPEGIATLMLY